MNYVIYDLFPMQDVYLVYILNEFSGQLHSIGVSVVTLVGQNTNVGLAWIALEKTLGNWTGLLPIGLVPQLKFRGHNFPSYGLYLIL